MKKELFEELCESIRQMGAIRRGQLKPGRVFVYPDKKAKLKAVVPMEIKSARTRLRLSQSEFAALIGVPKATLQGWEQGRRSPPGPACALLRVAVHRPDVVWEALHPKRMKAG